MPYTGPKSEMDPLALAVRGALKCASIVMHDDEFYDELVKHGGVIFQGKKPVIAHLNKGKFKPYGFYIIFPENKGYTYLEAEDLKRGYAIVDGKKIECPLRRNASLTSSVSILASEQSSTLPHLFRQMKDAIGEKDLKEIESLFNKIVKKSGVVMPKREPSKKDLELQAAFLPILRALGQHDKDIEGLASEINWKNKFELYINMEESVTSRILKDLEAVAGLLDFSLIVPSRGDSFNPSIYSAYSEENNDSVPKSKVIKCQKYGYKDGSQVRLKAKVILSRGK